MTFNVGAPLVGVSVETAKRVLPAAFQARPYTLDVPPQDGSDEAVHPCPYRSYSTARTLR